MYVCIYLCTYVCVYLCMYVRTYVHVSIHIYTCVWVYVCVSEQSMQLNGVLDISHARYNVPSALVLVAAPARSAPTTALEVLSFK